MYRFVLVVGVKLKIKSGKLTFGDDAQYWVDYGHGQIISKEEALALVRSARDLGAVHSVFHERDDANLPQVGICTCC